jgi:hypothetical protein
LCKYRNGLFEVDIFYKFICLFMSLLDSIIKFVFVIILIFNLIDLDQEWNFKFSIFHWGFVNITLFLAFLIYFTSFISTSFYFYLFSPLSLDLFKNNDEFFFKIDFPPPDLCCFGFLLTASSSVSPRFSLIYLLKTTWLLPNILCWLPSSESLDWLLTFYLEA